MKKKLSFREYVTVASMLFGMFFGAGNLIFPVSMGQQAGSHVWITTLGFLIIIFTFQPIAESVGVCCLYLGRISFSFIEA